MRTVRLEITPDQGRDYKSRKALQEDWNNGVSFSITGAQPPGHESTLISVEEAIDAGVSVVKARYNKSQYEVIFNL